MINDYDTSLRKELTELPLQRQSWFAGDLPTKVGQSRLEGLPLGTFLVRQRANNSLALMVKTADGVKQMKIEEAREITGHKSKGNDHNPLIFTAFRREKQLTKDQCSFLLDFFNQFAARM